MIYKQFLAKFGYVKNQATLEESDKFITTNSVKFKGDALVFKFAVKYLDGTSRQTEVKEIVLIKDLVKPAPVAKPVPVKKPETTTANTAPTV